MDYSKLELYIDGAWISGDSRTTEEVLNPATEDILGELPHSSTADLDLALQSSANAFRVWRHTSPLERGEILRKAAHLLRQRKEFIGQVLTLEEGKVLDQSIAEIVSCAETFEWFAEEGRRAFGRVIPPRDAGLNQITLPEPVGP